MLAAVIGNWSPSRYARARPNVPPAIVAIAPACEYADHADGAGRQHHAALPLERSEWPRIGLVRVSLPVRVKWRWAWMVVWQERDHGIGAALLLSFLEGQARSGHEWPGTRTRQNKATVYERSP
jgi:hypothetical protein